MQNQRMHARTFETTLQCNLHHTLKDPRDTLVICTLFRFGRYIFLAYITNSHFIQHKQFSGTNVPMKLFLERAGPNFTQLFSRTKFVEAMKRHSATNFVRQIHVVNGFDFVKLAPGLLS